jgi:hypothetical protein
LRQAANGQKIGPSFESAIAVSLIITLDNEGYRVNGFGLSPLKGLILGIFGSFVPLQGSGPL